MTLYVRKWNCSICGKPLIFDEKHTLSCGCGSFKASFVNLQEFISMPKYDSKFWQSDVLPIDSAKFLSNEILLDGSQVLFISDRQSIYRGNENPQAQLRWIHYLEKDKIQLCIAISGTFHTEKLAYNSKDANQWRERMWIYISPETVSSMIKFLEKNPQLIASWM
ncbi:MAG: hypothetical protein QW270_06675 [Candidatus Bathyarchaeia archaeon]